VAERVGRRYGGEKGRQHHMGTLTMVTRDLIIPKTNCAKYGPQQCFTLAINAKVADKENQLSKHKYIIN
jgi:ArsR family metal-binding transcriptional regulator